jgi:uncharacterized Zn-finger protein
MGRTKGAKNSKTPTPKTIKANTSPIRKHLVKMERKPQAEAPLQASLVLETPLLMCRRCQNAFETTDEYTSHYCPVQVFNVAVEEEIPEEFTIAEVIEAEDPEPIEEVKKKTPRKPYKKRVKKEPGEKQAKEPVQCPTCSKSFTRKYHLDRHLVHTSCNPGNIVRDEFACEVCGKSFSRIDNLRMHLRAHLGQKPRNRDFQCPYCEKSFYGSSLLNIHVRTHTREKPYLCDWEGCGKGFPSSGALTKHR